MSFSFRQAVRQNAGLLIGLVGPSGSGKTYSAMRLAAGIAAASGGKPFVVIDTEASRALHYADQFAFDHGDLTPPFRPERYLEAIIAADTAGYPAVVVDSFSHEHAGDGGLLDWHEEEMQRMAGEDARRRDAVNMAAWIKPKMAHKAMVQRLLQVRTHLILCFRAEEKIEMVRNKDTGKTEIMPKRSLSGFSGWIPVCEKTLPYELTASLLLSPEHPGVPLPIKLQAQHRPLFPEGQEITEKSGELLAAWAKGGVAKRPAPPTGEATSGPREAVPPAPAEDTSLSSAAGLDDAAERDVLLGRIEAGWAKCKTPAADQLKDWERQIGKTPFLKGGDLAALAGLLAELQTRYKGGK